MNRWGQPMNKSVCYSSRTSMVTIHQGMEGVVVLGRKFEARTWFGVWSRQPVSPTTASQRYVKFNFDYPLFSRTTPDRAENLLLLSAVSDENLHSCSWNIIPVHREGAERYSNVAAGHCTLKRRELQWNMVTGISALDPMRGIYLGTMWNGRLPQLSLTNDCLNLIVK